MDNLVRVATISPQVHVGNVEANIYEIKEAYEKFVKDRDVNKDRDINIVVTPELSLCGYTAQDLMFNQSISDYFAEDSVNADIKTLLNTVHNSTILVVGAPIVLNNAMYNCAIIIKAGEVLGVVPKCYLPNYNEFYERRWFDSGFGTKATSIRLWGQQVPFGMALVFNTGDFKFGVEICEDLWAPNPPSVDMALNGAEIILNLSASNETIGKSDYRRSLVAQQSARCICGYVYCSAGSSESTSDIVFSGHNMIAENGSILSEARLFDKNNSVIVNDIDLNKIRHDRMVNKTFTFGPRESLREIRLTRRQFGSSYKAHTLREISITPFVPELTESDKRCDEIFNIQTEALARRWKSIGCASAVVGVSGGLDSTLALLVAVRAADKLGYDHSRVLGITMPCFGTTSRTKSNAVRLMDLLGVSSKEINIEDSVKQHLKDIGLSEDDRSIAYENAQARERTQILMDIANMSSGFVVGTGDLSELALGWCTYNGDHMSMYGVNSSIPKTLVRILVNRVGLTTANTLDRSKRGEMLDCIGDILATPVSPELLPPSKDGTIAQLTEDSVGPYVLNDFFLYYTLRFGFSREMIISYAVEACQQSETYKYSEGEIIYWLDKFITRFKKAQFKRNCCPDGIKVGSVSLSPRGDWRMASEVE